MPQEDGGGVLAVSYPSIKRGMSHPKQALLYLIMGRRKYYAYAHYLENRLLNQEELHEFWRNPNKSNSPERYIGKESRSVFLLETLERYRPSIGSVLEIGCNVGRNLWHLYQHGYQNLHGIEINPDAIRLMREVYPQMAVRTYGEPVEDCITRFPDSEFDLVFTMAVLMHIPDRESWVFREMVRITNRVIVTMEDEGMAGSMFFPRNYQDVFEGLGMKQVEEKPFVDVEGSGDEYTLRLFQK